MYIYSFDRSFELSCLFFLFGCFDSTIAMGSNSWDLRGVALGVQPITIPNDQQAAMSKHQQWKYDLEVYSNLKSQSMDCSLHLPYTDYTHYTCKSSSFIASTAAQAAVSCQAPYTQPPQHPKLRMAEDFRT